MQFKGNHSQIIIDMCCWKLITVFFYCDCWYLSINRTDFCTGSSGKPSQCFIWKGISQLKSMPWVMFSAALEVPLCHPGRCPSSVGSVSSACLCCFWFLSPAGWDPLTVTNMKRILQSEHSGFGSAPFVPFIPFLSNIDRNDEWGSEVSLCFSPLPVDNCNTIGTFILGKCLKLIIKYSKSVVHLQLITNLSISYQEYEQSCISLANCVQWSEGAAMWCREQWISQAKFLSKREHFACELCSLIFIFFFKNGSWVNTGYTTWT